MLQASDLSQSELIRRVGAQLEDFSPEQTRTGASLIFRWLKHHLDDQDFDTLDTLIPESAPLAARAPAIEESDGHLFGGMRTAVGGNQLAVLGSLATLAGSFAKVGLKPERLPEFVQLLLSYIDAVGGPELRRTVARALQS